LATTCSGYLIVPTFEVTYNEFSRRLPLGERMYALPREGVPASAIEKKYRGIDRYYLDPWTEEDLRLGLPNTDPPKEPPASLALQELGDEGRADWQWIFAREDALAVFLRLLQPIDWEIIWAGEAAGGGREVADLPVLGYEPAMLGSGGSAFSAVSDCMCFPQWHGTDAEGQLFRAHHERLNRHALFDNSGDAKEFLDFYLSHDWTERGEFHIVEVRQVG